jgi:dTDP-4-dehydrorhamnose reductase
MKRGGSHLRIVNTQMSWLITGGSGQLGISVSQELRERGINHRSWSSSDLDITQGALVSKEIEKFSPKVIVNCAAWTDVDGAESQENMAATINSLGAGNVALAARNCGSKLVHISTDYVFSGQGDSPWSITSETLPSTAYGRTKVEGESRVLKLYSENSYVLRTAWLYGPWGKNFAKTMINLALKNSSEVSVVNDQVGQPTSSIDLAKQIVKLVESNSPVGIYHGTNSGSATWFEFAQSLFEMIGADVNRIVPVDSDKFPRPATRPKYSVLDHQEWTKTSIGEMQNWKTALEESFPKIFEAVMKEGGKIA